MKELSAAQLFEVNAGKLTDLRYTDKVWHFEFEGDLYIESYAGWRLLLHSNRAKLVLGSRDLEKEKNKYQQLYSYLGDVSCSVLTVNNLSNVHQLQFLDKDGNRISLELISNSSKKPNFKVVVNGEDNYDIEPE